MKKLILTCALSSALAPSLNAWPARTQPQQAPTISRTTAGLVSIITLAGIAYGLYAWGTSSYGPIGDSKPSDSPVGDSDYESDTFNVVPAINIELVAEELGTALARIRDPDALNKKIRQLTNGKPKVRKALTEIFTPRSGTSDRPQTPGERAFVARKINRDIQQVSTGDVSDIDIGPIKALCLEAS